MHERESDSLESKIDLRLVFFFLKRRAIILLLSVFIGMMAGFLIFSNATPSYIAYAEVMTGHRPTPIVTPDVMLNEPRSETTAIDTETEVLRSIALARSVVQQHGLINDPAFVDPADGANQLAGADKAALEEDIAAQIQSSTSVSRLGQTYIISVGYEAEDPQLAARMANLIVSTYLANQLGQKSDALEMGQGWLQDRLNKLRQEVLEAEAAVANFRAERDLTRAGGMTLSEGQLLQLNDMLAKAEAERASAEARLRDITAAESGSLPIEALQEVLLSDVIENLRTQQGEVARKRAEMRVQLGANHPQLVTVNREYSDLEQQIQAEIARIRGSIEDQYRQSVAREQSVRAQLGRLETTTVGNESDLVKLRDLERTAEATRLTYQTLLTRAQEVADQTRLIGPDATMLSAASPPLEPASPQLSRIMIASVFVSFVLGLGLALLREFSFTGVTSSEELEQKTGVPFFASIPRLQRSRRRAVQAAAQGVPAIKLNAVDFVVDRPQSQFSEAMWRLQLMINAAADATPNTELRRLVVTSAMPGEGKSTTATALARCFALSRQRTLLIDADLRRPTVHRHLRVRPHSGLVDVLNGRELLSEAVYVDERTGLHYVPVGSRVKNPRALLGSAQFNVLLDSLASGYDRVVIDAPPIMPVPDAILLGKWADAALLLVKWRETELSLVRKAIKELQSANIRVLGGVLAQVDNATMRTYGYYSYSYPAAAAQTRKGSNIVPWISRGGRSSGTQR